jgi:formylglycine-generating enzyme required for sulfatase activity
MLHRLPRALAAFLLLLVGASCAEPIPTPAPPTPTPTPQVSTTLTLAEDIRLEFLRVPAGKFTMGSTDDEPDAQMDEKPQHTVYLDEYEIGKYEVTIAQFRAFVKATGRKTMAEVAGYAWTYTGASDFGWDGVDGATWQHPRGPGSDVSAGDNYPVTQVGWDDAVAFCAWASEVTGRSVRLPTEAQWEKAARGADGRKFPWGNDAPAGNLTNYADSNLPEMKQADVEQDDGHQYAAPVGSYPAGASPCGALDMVGNVGEWVADLYGLKYYAKSPADNPAGPVTGMQRVQRGGHYAKEAEGLRCSERGAADPGLCQDTLGFRVCLVPATP